MFWRASGTLFFSVLVLIFCSCSQPPSRPPEQAAKQQPVVRQEESPRNKELRASLRDTADRLFAILKDGDPQHLLPFFSSTGTVFEVDEPVIPRTILERTFARKKSYYCLFFDTNCMRSEANKMRLKAGAPPSSVEFFSFRDQIRKDSGRRFKVLLNLQNKEPLGQISMEHFEFLLDLENGEWKIVTVQSD